MRQLLAAGADPATTDAHGRTAADWGAAQSGPPAEAHDGDVLWTRIRAIDLFAPLRRGALVHIPPAYGLGAIVTVLGVVDALARALVDDRVRARTLRAGRVERETRDSGP